MDTTQHYQFRIKGRLGPEWSAWFEGLTISHQPGGDTLLTGPVADQAALHGILIRIRNLGLPLISINPVSPDARQTGPV